VHRRLPGTIIKELLPFPFVLYPDLYGTFLGFSSALGDEWVLCGCSERPVESLLLFGKQVDIDRFRYFCWQEFPDELFQRLPEAVVSSCSPQDYFSFKDGLCHLCAKGVPSRISQALMYGNLFEHRFGWYVRQEYLALGQVGEHFTIPRFLPEPLWPEWFGDALAETEEVRAYLEIPFIDVYRRHTFEYGQQVKRLRKFAQQAVRQRYGLKTTAGLNELLLYHAVCQVFPEEKVVRRVRPKWLDGLELDVFVPMRKLAFEYHGEQHFKPVKYFGGEAALPNQKERDQKKKILCKVEGVALIVVRHSEFIDTDMIRRKLAEL
jgi:hypothetical protein